MATPEKSRFPMERPESVPPDQEWFWTPEWQAGEREADAEIAAGGGQTFYSTEEFLAHLDSIPLPTEESPERKHQ